MHFYTKTATGIEPRHFVTQKNDPTKQRASRTSDAKAALKAGEKWYASVTTILGVLDKPALISWKIDQHLKTVFEGNNSLEGHCDFDSFARHIKALTEARLDEAPKAGTNIHNVLEKYFRDSVIPDDEIELKICKNVEAVLLENCGKQEWEYEKYFVDEERGFAGCADLVSLEWVVDYKSKQEAVKFKPGKMAYPEHSRQLGAYAHGFKILLPKAANIFICLENGEVDFHRHCADDICNGWFDFSDCLNIFERNTYDPA